MEAQRKADAQAHSTDYAVQKQLAAALRPARAAAHEVHAAAAVADVEKQAQAGHKQARAHYKLPKAAHLDAQRPKLSAVGESLGLALNPVL